MRTIIHTKIYSWTYIIVLLLTMALQASLALPTSALSYEDGTSIQFTFNSALSVSVSGNLIINELAPGSSSDSNIITVDVSTNNISGYNLYATVGNDTDYDNTDLSHIYTNPSTGEPVSKFTSLTTSDSIANIANLEPDTWGYSYATTYNDNASTWTNWTSYSGLPKYDNESTIINSATNSTNSTTGFKIAAKADTNQIAGDYNNVINFVAITNKAPVSFYDAYKAAHKEMYLGYYKLQDMSQNICEAIDVISADSASELIDIRDNQVYTVAKLYDERCWMIDNLNLGDTDNYPLEVDELTSNNTNIDTALSAETFNSWKTNVGHNLYTEPEYISVPGVDETSRSIYGTLYTYCATTAATYCYNYNHTAGVGDAVYDLCPSNWRLPTGYPSNGELQALYAKYNTYEKLRAPISEDGAAFALSGDFFKTSYQGQGEYAFYRSSSMRTRSRMYSLDFVDGTAVTKGSIVIGRDDGGPVRCIAN